MQLADIFLSGDVSEAELITTIAGLIGRTKEAVFVTSDIANAPASPPVLVEVQNRPGGFPMQLSIYLRGQHPGAPTEVDLAVALARALDLRALIGDDTVNPYAWKLVERDGTIQPVSVDPDGLDRGELRITT